MDNYKVAAISLLVGGPIELINDVILLEDPLAMMPSESEIEAATLWLQEMTKQFAKQRKRVYDALAAKAGDLSRSLIDFEGGELAALLFLERFTGDQMKISKQGKVADLPEFDEVSPFTIEYLNGAVKATLHESVQIQWSRVRDTFGSAN